MTFLEHIFHLSYVSLLLNEMPFSEKKNLCFYVVKKQHYLYYRLKTYMTYMFYRKNYFNVYLKPKKLRMPWLGP
jgi:hypothetical protein